MRRGGGAACNGVERAATCPRRQRSVLNRPAAGAGRGRRRREGVARCDAPSRGLRSPRPGPHQNASGFHRSGSAGPVAAAARRLGGGDGRSSACRPPAGATPIPSSPNRTGKVVGAYAPVSEEKIRAPGGEGWRAPGVGAAASGDSTTVRYPNKQADYAVCGPRPPAGVATCAALAAMKAQPLSDRRQSEDGFHRLGSADRAAAAPYQSKGGDGPNWLLVPAGATPIPCSPKMKRRLGADSGAILEVDELDLGGDGVGPPAGVD